MKAIKNKDKRKEIIDSYFDYFNAYAGRQWEEVNSCLSEGITMFGTGVDEVAFDGHKTRSFLRREFQQAPLPITYKVHHCEVFEITEDVALLMLIMDMHLICNDEPIVFANNRTSAIMAYEGGKWKLSHGHWSQPDKDIDVGESVPYRLLMERSRQLEERVLERTRKINEQKEELAKINQTKDKLLSIIAHDLKNPFNSILGFSDILAEDSGKFDSDKIQNMCRLIHQQAQSAYSLLENMLQWAKTQTDQIVFKPESIPLKNLVDEAVSQITLLSHKKNTYIELNVEGDLRVVVDRQMLQIVLRNLLSNAVKYTKQEGRVLVTAVQDNGMTRVSVRDNGVGINKGKLYSLEQGVPVRTTQGTENEIGSGLGLLLCREFIDKMNGVLEIESTEGQGSCFSFTIPAA